MARFCQALAVAPNDLITTFNLARELLQLDPKEHRDEADQLLLQLIEAQPYGELANKAKDLRGSIAARDRRADQPEQANLKWVAFTSAVWLMILALISGGFLLQLERQNRTLEVLLERLEPATERSRNRP